MRRRPQPPADPAARPLTVIHANLLYINRRVADVPAALARSTPTSSRSASTRRSHAARLHRSPLAAAYPYRIELPAALRQRHRPVEPLSRRPSDDSADTKHHTVVADVDAPGRAGARHRACTPRARSIHHRQWADDLDRLGARSTVDRPARDDRRLQRRLVAPRVPPPARRTAGATPTSSSAAGCRARGRRTSGTPCFHVPPAVRPARPRPRQRRARRARRRSTSTSPAATTSGCSSPCSELREQRPERPAPVREGVLLVVGHLGERAPVAVVGDEHGVVAEPAPRRARPSAIVPSHTPSTATSRAVGPDDHGHRAEPGPAVVDAVERGEQLGAGCRRSVASSPA